MISHQVWALFNIPLDSLLDQAVQQLIDDPTLNAFLQQQAAAATRWQQRRQQLRQQWRYHLDAMTLAAPLSAEIDQFLHHYPDAKPTAQQPLTNQLLSALAQWHSPFYPQAKQLLTQQASHQSWQYLFYQCWYQSLQSQLLLACQQLLTEQQQQQLDELQHEIQQFQQVAQLFSQQSYGGRLWDLSHSQLQAGDYQQLYQYHQLLSHQPALLALAKQLGRQQQPVAAATTPQTIPHNKAAWQQGKPTDELADTLSSLRLSNDLLRLVPTQLAALAIAELEYEFYRQLLEKQLLTYQLTSDQQPITSKTATQPRTATDTDQPQAGPFIVCVDTSGSMGGFNERCAKAFCLALLEVALAENRSCHVMLFSSQVVHYQFDQADGLSQAARFLAQRFQGGTNLAACLSETLTLLQQHNWQQADVVIISDFIAERLSTQLIDRIQAIKQHQQHFFHAITVSPHGKPQIMAIFDYIWQMRHYLSHRILANWLTR